MSHGLDWYREWLVKKAEVVDIEKALTLVQVTGKTWEFDTTYDVYVWKKKALVEMGGPRRTVHTPRKIEITVKYKPCIESLRIDLHEDEHTIIYWNEAQYICMLQSISGEDEQITLSFAEDAEYLE